MTERSEESRTFEQLWRDIREDGEVIPKRNAFKPELFRAYLPRIIIHEVDVENERFIIRLLGEDARQYLGFDARGFDTNQLVEEKQRPLLLERLRAYHDRPYGRVLLSAFSQSDGSLALYENTYLPLQGMNGERIVCSLVMPIERPASLDVSGLPAESYHIVEEVLLDVGVGLPNFIHHVEDSLRS